VRAILVSVERGKIRLSFTRQSEAVLNYHSRRLSMDSYSELNLVDDQNVKTDQQSDTIDLSLGDLDIVGGGSIVLVFQ
jgi:hypothetical protein